MQGETKPHAPHQHSAAEAVTKSLISAAIGTIFGFALNRGLVYHPVVIREQFIAQNFTMMKMFLSAVSSSLIVNSIMSLIPQFKNNFDKSREKYHKGPIPSKQILIGAALLGVGMAVSGACPGTVAAQLGAGMNEAIFTLIGALVGGTAFMLSESALDSPKSVDPTATLEKNWKVPYSTIALPLSAALGAFVYVLEYIRPWTIENQVALTAAGMPSNHPFSFSNPIWPPYVAGIVIGLLQLFNVQFLSHNIGCSSSYTTVLAQSAYNLLPKSLHKHIHLALQKRIGLSSLIEPTFVAGAILGSYFAGSAVHITSPLFTSPIRSFLGGSVLIFGARVAHGCTSGHGISGFSNLNWRSFLAVAGMFAGAFVAGFGLKAVGLFH